MVVLLNIGVEDDCPLAKDLSLQQSFVDQKIQRIVYGRTGDCRTLFAHMLKHFIRRGVSLALENTLDHRHPLWRWLDSALTKQRNGSFHELKIES